MRAEEALEQPARLVAGEARAVALELVDRRGRLAAEQLDGVVLAQEVPVAQRVGGMLLPGVLGIGGAERSVDAAGREHRVAVEAAPLADDEHVRPGLAERDGRAQAGGPGPDDERVRHERTNRSAHRPGRMQVASRDIVYKFS